MAAKLDFEFEDFAKLCPDIDVERFRESYDVMLDINGAVFSHTIGFHFDFDTEDPSREAMFVEMVELFKPVVIWAGTKTVRQRIRELGYRSALFPYFQDGGFMVVLKVPVPRDE